MMVVLHPDAERDIEEAHRWYGERSPVAAAAFLAELTNVIERLADRALPGIAYLAGTRRCALRTFPFNVICRVETSRIILVALAHHRRRPGYWQLRH